MSALSEAVDRVGPCFMHPVIDFADPEDGAQIDPRQRGNRKVAAFEDLYELDIVYDACLGISSEVLRKIGMLDERFFLQLEETDFWYRARDKGYRSYCTVNAKILHAESALFQGKVAPMKLDTIIAR